MLKRVGLYVLEALCFIPLLAAFFSIVSFMAAKTPAEVVASGGPPLPATWEVGVPNHGSYYEWYAISNHPGLDRKDVRQELMNDIYLKAATNKIQVNKDN